MRITYGGNVQRGLFAHQLGLVAMNEKRPQAIGSEPVVPIVQGPVVQDAQACVVSTQRHGTGGGMRRYA